MLSAELLTKYNHPGHYGLGGFFLFNENYRLCETVFSTISNKYGSPALAWNYI